MQPGNIQGISRKIPDVHTKMAVTIKTALGQETQRMVADPDVSKCRSHGYLLGCKKIKMQPKILIQRIYCMAKNLFLYLLAKMAAQQKTDLSMYENNIIYINNNINK